MPFPTARQQSGVIDLVESVEDISWTPKAEDTCYGSASLTRQQ